MKITLTLFLLCLTTSLFSQTDWIVTHNKDSLTGTIIRKASDLLFIYKVIDGDTVGKMVPASDIKSFYTSNKSGYTLPPKTHYSLEQRVEHLERSMEDSGFQLENAGQNLLLAPVPAAIGGGLASLFFVSAYNQEIKVIPDYEQARLYRGIGYFLIGAGTTIATYMVIRAYAQIHKAGREMK